MGLSVVHVPLVTFQSFQQARPVTALYLRASIATVCAPPLLNILQYLDLLPFVKTTFPNTSHLKQYTPVDYACSLSHNVPVRNHMLTRIPMEAVLYIVFANM